MLSPGERATWQALPPSPRRALQWLAGRIAAKDLVRSLLADRSGIVLHPVQIEIASGAHGAPQASVPPTARLSCPIRVSIAHSGAIAVALASADPATRGVGIDVEHLRVRRALERKGLTAAERERLDAAPPAQRAEIGLRWWSAKEAAAKALGAGLDRLGGAQRISVSALRPDSSVLQVTVAGSAGFPPGLLIAETRRDGDLVVATVVDSRP